MLWKMTVASVPRLVPVLMTLLTAVCAADTDVDAHLARGPQHHAENNFKHRRKAPLVMIIANTGIGGGADGDDEDEGDLSKHIGSLGRSDVGRDKMRQWAQHRNRNTARYYRIHYTAEPHKRPVRPARRPRKGPNFLKHDKPKCRRIKLFNKNTRFPNRRPRERLWGHAINYGSGSYPRPGRPDQGIAPKSASYAHVHIDSEYPRPDRPDGAQLPNYGNYSRPDHLNEGFESSYEIYDQRIPRRPRYLDRDQGSNNGRFPRPGRPNTINTPRPGRPGGGQLPNYGNHPRPGRPDRGQLPNYGNSSSPDRPNEGLESSYEIYDQRIPRRPRYLDRGQGPNNGRLPGPGRPNGPLYTVNRPRPGRPDRGQLLNDDTSSSSDQPNKGLESSYEIYDQRIPRRPGRPDGGQGPKNGRNPRPRRPYGSLYISNHPRPGRPGGGQLPNYNNYPRPGRPGRGQSSKYDIYPRPGRPGGGQLPNYNNYPRPGRPDGDHDSNYDINDQKIPQRPHPLYRDHRTNNEFHTRPGRPEWSSTNRPRAVEPPDSAAILPNRHDKEKDNWPPPADHVETQD